MIRGRIDENTYKQMRQFPGLKYSKTHKCFYFPFSEKALNDFTRRFGLNSVREQQSHTSPCANEDSAILREYQEKLTNQRYGDSTIRNYEVQFRKFLMYLRKKQMPEINELAINHYMTHLTTIRRASISTQNVCINAIKFYLEKVQKGERKVYYNERPRKEQKLPTVLSEEEIVRLLEKTRNLKQRTLLLLIYSAGLRISEALNLRWTDLDRDRKTITVRQGKGKKDRITLLSQIATEFLRRYRTAYETADYIFEGMHGGAYSARSVNNTIKRSAKAAGISKSVSAHTLRHSFATHLLEHGTDMRYIQVLLGHENVRTTERYAHVTKRGFEGLRSPLDNLQFGSKLDGDVNKDISAING